MAVPLDDVAKVVQQEKEKPFPDLKRLYFDKERNAHSNTMVAFHVGPGPYLKCFLVHKHLACSHSPFFKAAFESRTTEDITQTMHFEDVDPSVFGYLVHWMYKHDFEQPGLGRCLDENGVLDMGQPYAEMLRDPTNRAEAIAALSRSSSHRSLLEAWCSELDRKSALHN